MSSDLRSIAAPGYPSVDTNTASAGKKVETTTVVAASAPEVSQPLSPQAVRVLQVDNQSLQFSMDETSGKVVVKVLDGSTGNVIRQIPSEQALEIAQALDQLRGFFVNAKA